MFSVRFIFILCDFAIFSSQNRPLSLSLIVGDTLCLRSSGLTGGEGENEENDYVRHDVVEVDRETKLLESAYAVTVDIKVSVGGSNTLEEAEQKRAERYAHRLPVTEDHNREGEEAHTRDRTLCGTGGDGSDVDISAHACKGARDSGAEVSHPIHVDANAVCCLGVLTAGAETKTVFCLIKEYRQDDKQCDNDIG